MTASPKRGEAGSSRRPEPQSLYPCPRLPGEPARLPRRGLGISGRVRGVINGDHLLVDFDGGCEVDLFLIGVDAPEPGQRTETGFRISEAARAFADVTRAVLHRQTGRPTFWIPQPRFDRGWIHELRPRGKHAGYLYFGDGPSINAQIVALARELFKDRHPCNWQAGLRLSRAAAAGAVTRARAA